MQYLYDPQHYVDRYDLLTIERCLKEIEILNKVIVKMRNDPKLKMESSEEKQKAVNYLVNTRLLSVKLDRYERREKTIEDWIEVDRKEQDAQDHTTPPKGVKCDKCNATMKSTFHHLHNDYDKPIRVLFFFDCPKCKSRKAVFDDGEEWKHESSLCEKCGSELKRKSTRKAHVVTITRSCSKCGFKEVDVMDSKKDEAERKQKEDHEKELLTKYRTEFCLEKEEAEKWITCFEEMSFGQQVYEHELQERSDRAYEQYENLKKLNISELEQTINKSLADNKYDKLILKEPRFNKLVEVDFTVQDTDTSRSRKDSEKQLEKLISKLLIDTNWRLSNSSITYRLGYLVGQLNGYESEEDLLKLLGKKKLNLNL